MLNSIKSVEGILQGLTNIKGEFTSARLVQLISYEEEGGLLPSDIQESLDEFEKLIVWKVVQNTDKKIEIPEPQHGIDETYDQANDEINQIK